MIGRCHDARAVVRRLPRRARAFKLFANSRHRRRVAAARTRCRTAFHRAVEFRVFDFGLGIVLVHPAVALLDDDLEVHALGLLVRHKLQGHGAVGFLGEPEGADERHFRAAAGPSH